MFRDVPKHLMVFFLSSPSLSVPRRGHKGPDGVGAQGAVREAVSGLQHDLPADKAGAHHGLRWEQLRLRVQLARHPLQLWTGLWRSQEEARSVKKLHDEIKHYLFNCSLLDKKKCFSCRFLKFPSTKMCLFNWNFNTDYHLNINDSDKH